MLLEIGPGRGDFLFWLARNCPAEEVLGIEYKKKRFDKLRRRIERNGLGNIRLLLGDARATVPTLPPCSIREVYILFSDPWPKRRHERRRLFQSGFVEEIYRVLTKEGKVVIATDDARYREEIENSFRLFPSFLAREDGLQFRTFYAQKWLEEGRTLFSFSYVKKDDAEPTPEST